DHGLEVLVHIGLDTVQLEGKYFEAHIKQGEHVTKGQKLVSFDIKALQKEGYCLDTPIIVTNTNDYLDIVETQEKTASNNTEIITVLS
ncbi:MAG: PTS glucose transporter subunit IIA, partial [Anaerorhabdus sp.]